MPPSPDPFDGIGRRAVLITGDRFDDAKTAHGLLRHSPRFEVVAVVDDAHAGRPTSTQIPDAPARPVVDRVAAVEGPVDVAIIGIATYGGGLPDLVRGQVLDAIERGWAVVSGLHEPVASDPRLAEAAARHGTRVVELRAPRPFADQHFWTGAALEVTTPRLAVLGTDCDIGKRTTMQLLIAELERRRFRVETVATGQTGLLQGARQGFVLDATPLDFISGALELAILAAAEREPDLIVIQGQGSFRGPTGQVGPQLLVHTGVRHVVLQHAPHRAFYKGRGEVPIADVQGDLDLVAQYGAEVIGLALGGGRDETTATQRALAVASAAGIAACWPLHDGVGLLADAVCDQVLS